MKRIFYFEKNNFMQEKEEASTITEGQHEKSLKVKPKHLTTPWWRAAPWGINSPSTVSDGT